MTVMLVGSANVSQIAWLEVDENHHAVKKQPVLALGWHVSV